jgi:hypothetical protein
MTIFIGFFSWKAHLMKLTAGKARITTSMIMVISRGFFIVFPEFENIQILI